MSTQEANGKGGAPQDAASNISACPDEMALAACLDGKLSDDDLARIHLHLEHCEACRCLMETIRENYAQLGRSCGDEEPGRSRLSDLAKKLKPR